MEAATRRQAQMPTTDMVEEVRIESSNFDAGQGHGTGLQISMMTRAGRNTYHGSADYQHWTNKLNAMNVTQKATFARSPETKAAWREGRSHQFVGTIGGPVVIPKLIDAFFTSATIQRQNLIRAFPEYGGAGVTYANLPLGKNRTHSLEVSVQRCFSHGASGNFNYMFTHSDDLTRVETYERAPTLWQPSNNARPHRVTASGLLDVPFGRSRRFLNNGGVPAEIAGGWQLSGTFEDQPAQLLNWGNLFFYGKLEDIKLDHPTLDRWFNIDAGFERDPNKVPAANFQKRTFRFRVDGVRGYNLVAVNMSLLRNIAVGEGRTVSLRVNAQNLFNRQGWNAPNLTPTSTQFGKITTPSGMAMRFITFVMKFSF